MLPSNKLNSNPTLQILAKLRAKGIPPVQQPVDPQMAANAPAEMVGSPPMEEGLVDGQNMAAMGQESGPVTGGLRKPPRKKLSVPGQQLV